MLLIGKIIGTRGLKGEVKIYPYTNFPEDFERIKKVYLDANPEKSLLLQKQKMQKNLILAFFEGVDSIDKAEQIKNVELYLDEEESARFLSDDSYFYKDIIGIEVKSVDGTPLGRVTGVNTSSKQNLILVEKEGKEWLLPNVPHFVKKVDIEHGLILVELIEGMIDED